MKRFFLFIVGLWVCVGVFAQEGKEIQLYKQAEEAYKIGRFEEAIKLLSDNLDDFSSRTRETSLRLLALCYLEEDKTTEAEQYVSMLLKYNPYYTVSFSDPLRFADMIERLKKGQVTITTASQQAENIDEAPVPVTLITEEMIKAIGARNLKDVLLAYVPGMTSVEGLDEDNVAMHGVYSAGQEKILIMLNGQRMNARSTNKAAPDYSISLDKVKQIEVLRGPASSLYGNVALVAVVNLITKDGVDIDGIELSAGVGNFGTRKVDLLFGKHFVDIDFMGWASFYTSKGEKVFVPKASVIGENPHDGYTRIGAYNHKPSYDYGCVVNWKDLSLTFNRRYGKKVPSYADIYTSLGALYDYDSYKRINGESVGLGMTFTHAGVSYAKQFGNISLNLDAYFDLNESLLYSVSGDSVYSVLSEEGHYGYFQVINWTEYVVGGNAMANISYDWLGKGNLLIGTQIEYMNLNGAEGYVGDNFTNVFMYWPINPVKLGHETSYSPFIQLKHAFSDNWILNIGGREDFKKRKSGVLYSSFSPRLSLIYIMNERFNVKGSYARSFVDAPYYYRYNESPSSKGPEDMRPEHMNAVQFSLNYNPLANLSWSNVFFYNKLTDFIYRDANAEADDYRYLNAGELQTLGVESTLQYRTPRFFTNFNLTWQHVLKGKSYTFSGHQVYNVPNWFANLTLQGNVIKRGEHALWLYGNGRLTGRQLSPIENVMIGGEYKTDMENTLPTNFVMNAGVRYQYKRLGAELSFYNLLDNTYYQGGSTSVPYIQQGFSTVFSLTYKID